MSRVEALCHQDLDFDGRKMDQIRSFDGRSQRSESDPGLCMDNSGDFAWIIVRILHGSQWGPRMDQIRDHAWIIVGTLHGSELGLCMVLVLGICMDQSRDSAWIRSRTLMVDREDQNGSDPGL